MNVPFIFAFVLRSTIYGSIVGIIIFILKSAVLKRLTARWQYYLWFVMILKLVFPNGPKSNISVFNQIKVSSSLTKGDVFEAIEKTGHISESAIPLFDIISYLWFFGFIIVFLWLIVSFTVLSRKIHITEGKPSESTLEIFNSCKDKTGVKRGIELVVQNHIPTAALIGIFKPKILITRDFEQSDIQHIEYSLIHELSHYKRRDAAINFFILLIRCIHWFNPVLWFLFKKLRRDTEIATDEKTMLYLKPAEHKAYGMVLINTMSSGFGTMSGVLSIANNAYDIKKRIKAIAKFKKPNFVQHISGFFTLVLIAVICLTSAAIAKPISDIIYQNLPIPDSLVTQNSTFVLSDADGMNNEDTKAGWEIEDASKTLPDNAAEDKVPDTGVQRTKKYIYYNSDSQSFYGFSIKPDSSGQLRFLIKKDSQYDHEINVEISSVQTPGKGWFYTFYSGSAEPYIIDGLNPNMEYYVTVNTFCPGYYGITGEITIY